MAVQDNSVLYNLEKGYQITRVLGKECLMIMRDKYSTPLATIELCQNKISAVTPYREAENDKNYIRVLQKFVQRHHYILTKDAALDLGFSIVCKDGEEEYFRSEELTSAKLESFFSSYDSLTVILNNFRKHKLNIPRARKQCTLDFTHAEISRIIISPNSHAAIDLRDNRFVGALIVGDSFNGSLNFSRSALLNIRFGDNCRCDISCTHSGKCFEMSLGDVYSGVMDIKDSCFHRLKVGYYCYAVIRLTENWGRKDVIIGDSFRGSLMLDSVEVNNLEIGDDCRGRIAVTEKDNRQGIHSFDIADDFQGDIDLASSQRVEQVDVGSRAAGTINLSGCPSIQSLKFEQNFSGTADLSDSGVVYIRAKDGCTGQFILLNCENLSLLKLPKDKRANITVERMPKTVAADDRNFYYRFDEKELDPERSTPFYFPWLKKAKRFFRHYFS